MKTGNPAAVSRLRLSRFVVISAALLCLQTAVAQLDQRSGLHFDSGRADTARAVEQALREGNPWEQLEWTFTLRPSLLYRRYLDEPHSELFSPRLSTTLQVRFGEKPLQSLRRALKLERALRAHDRAGRLEVRSALLAHADLLLAQDAFAVAEAALAGSAAESALDLQAAELAARTARLNLDRAREAAAAYGLSGVASYRSLRFELPAAPRISNLSLYRQQELAVAEAELLYLEAGAAGMLQDFRLGAAVRSEGIDLDFETGLMAGRPGLRIGTIHPGGRARVELRVSATIAIGDSLSDLPQLADEIVLAREELEVLALSLQADWLIAHEDAVLAAEELGLAEMEVAAAIFVLEESRLAEAGLPEGAAERELASLQTATLRAEREVQRLQTRVYRAWVTYVRRHHELLEAAEGKWILMSQSADFPPGAAAQTVTGMFPAEPVRYTSLCEVIDSANWSKCG